MCGGCVAGMVHSKTLFKQRTSDTKRFCKFSLISKGSKVTHGVYDRETDKFYGLNKHGKPFMKTAYSTPKQFAVSHGCKAVHFAQHIHVHGKTLKQLATEGVIFTWIFAWILQGLHAPYAY